MDASDAPVVSPPASLPAAEPNTETAPAAAVDWSKLAPQLPPPIVIPTAPAVSLWSRFKYAIQRVRPRAPRVATVGEMHLGDLLKERDATIVELTREKLELQTRVEILEARVTVSKFELQELGAMVERSRLRYMADKTRYALRAAAMPPPPDPKPQEK